MVLGSFIIPKIFSYNQSTIIPYSLRFTYDARVAFVLVSQLGPQIRQRRGSSDITVVTSIAIDVGLFNILFEYFLGLTCADQ